MKFTFDAQKMMSVAWCLFLAYAMMLVPADALAQIVPGGNVNVNIGGPGGGGGGGTIGNVLCNVADWFTGPVGQGIATLAILVIGVGALMGKVSWGMAIIVGIGVAVIFGAPQIVAELGTAGSGC